METAEVALAENPERKNLTTEELAEAVRYHREQIRQIRQQIEQANARAEELWRMSCEVCERAERVRQHIWR